MCSISFIRFSVKSLLSEIVLAEVSPSGTPLSAEMSDGVLTISTRDDIESPTAAITEVYDIRDILNEAPTNDYAATDDEWTASITSLMNLIRDAVSPNLWKENGGTIGSMSEFHGRLVITQTKPQQAQIQRLLAQLRHPLP